MAQSETFFEGHEDARTSRFTRRDTNESRRTRLPLPQLRLYRNINNLFDTSEQREHNGNWQAAIDDMALMNRGRGEPATRALLHVTYVSDLDMKRMIEESRPGLLR